MAGTITALRIQKRRKYRVNVYVDDAYAFSVQYALAAELHRGQSLSDEQIAELLKRDAAETAYERALHYLSYRPRSAHEIRQYLHKKEIDEATIERVFARLERAKLVDDADFARFWIENRERFRPRGAWALRAELRQKGIPNDIIESLLAEVDEEQNAFVAARRRVERLARLDEETFRHRLFAFLQRRGFGYDISRQVVDRLWLETSERAKGNEERAWPDNGQ